MKKTIAFISVFFLAFIASATFVTNNFGPPGAGYTNISITFTPTGTPLVLSNGQVVYSTVVKTNTDTNGFLWPTYLVYGPYNVQFGPKNDLWQINVPYDTNTYPLWTLATNINVVSNVASLPGVTVIYAGSNVTVSSVGSAYTINSSGGGGGGLYTTPNLDTNGGLLDLATTIEPTNILTKAWLQVNGNQTNFGTLTVGGAATFSSTLNAAGTVTTTNLVVTNAGGPVAAIEIAGNAGSGGQTAYISTSPAGFNMTPFQIPNGFITVNLAGSMVETNSGAYLTNIPPTALQTNGAAIGQAVGFNGTSIGFISIPGANVINIANSPYNAVNDGVTDNTLAFSNAIIAAGDNGTVYAPDVSPFLGYKVKGGIFILQDYVTIEGDGPGNWILGKASTFSSCIIWSNLVTNCFTCTSKGVTFKNISGFWTNSSQPSAGAFLAVTTNADGVNGNCVVNFNNVFLDGGYRCIDDQADNGLTINNLVFVRWYYDGIRLNNYANNDLGGWAIYNSSWEAVGNGMGAVSGAGSHIARSAIRWEGGGAGIIFNTSGSAFNWGSYGDTGGYTNAIDIQPEAQAGAATSGISISQCGPIDNWGQNAIYTHSGNTTFSVLRITDCQMESYVSFASYPIALTGGIGNTCLIDGCLAQNPTGGAFVYENAMTGLQIGFLAGYSPPLVNVSDGGTPELLPDGTAIYDNYGGRPQIREGSFFLQSQNTNSWTIGANGYYTSGWYNVNKGASAAINYDNNASTGGVMEFALWPANGTAGSTVSTYPVFHGFYNQGAGYEIAYSNFVAQQNVGVGNTLAVTNTATFYGAPGIVLTNNSVGPQATFASAIGQQAQVNYFYGAALGWYQFATSSLFGLYDSPFSHTAFQVSNQTESVLFNGNIYGASNLNVSGVISGNLSGATNLLPTSVSTVGSTAGQFLTSAGNGGASGWGSVPNANYVNILLYGGVEDGNTLTGGVTTGTDNNQAFSNACAAAGPIGTVYLPHTNPIVGSGYRCSGNLHITNTILNIIGDGQSTVPALGFQEQFLSVIIWTNLVTNCFRFEGSQLTFRNISAYWTNNTPPTGGAFLTVTTNYDQVNGQVAANFFNVTLDGGYRLVDYQAGQSWVMDNVYMVRWWYDGLRIQNYANSDIGGWTIRNSTWGALAGLQYTTGAHQARSWMRFEGSGGGIVLNCGGGALNWGSYGDPGGYTNAVDVEPYNPSGKAASGGLTFQNTLLDNWGQNAVFSQSPVGGCTFTGIKMFNCQMESYVSGAQQFINLNGGIGNGGLFDQISSDYNGLPGGANGYPIAVNGMNGLNIGMIGANPPSSIKGPVLDTGGSASIFTLPIGTGNFDTLPGNPQIAQGAYFMQSENSNGYGTFLNGYYNGSGLYYPFTGPGFSEEVFPTSPGTTLNYAINFFPTQSAGTTAGYSTRTNTMLLMETNVFGIGGMQNYSTANAVIFGTNNNISWAVGIGTTSPASTLTVNGTLSVSNLATFYGGQNTVSGGTTNTNSIGFIGNGSGLTNLNAANLTGGPITNTVEATNIAGTITNAISTGAAVIAGNASGLTNLNAANLTGGPITNTVEATNIAGTITNAISTGAAVIAGNASGLTNLNAANLTGGPITNTVEATNIAGTITNAISTGAAVIAGNGSGLTNTPVPYFTSWSLTVNISTTPELFPLGGANTGNSSQSMATQLPRTTTFSMLMMNNANSGYGTNYGVYLATNVVGANLVSTGFGTTTTNQYSTNAGSFTVPGGLVAAWQVTNNDNASILIRHNLSCIIQ